MIKQKLVLPGLIAISIILGFGIAFLVGNM